MALKRAAREAGFTIIESMVAMTILLVGLMALALLQNTAYRANSLARNRSAATVLASERIERLSRLGAGNFTAGSATRTIDGRTFTESWTIATAPSVTSGAQSVQMQVQWSDQWGNHTIQFPTVVR